MKAYENTNGDIRGFSEFCSPAQVIALQSIKFSFFFGDFFSQAEVALKVLLLQNRQCCKYQEAIFLFKMIKHDLIGNFRDTCGTIP